MFCSHISAPGLAVLTITLSVAFANATPLTGKAVNIDARSRHFTPAQQSLLTQSQFEGPRIGGAKPITQYGGLQFNGYLGVEEVPLIQLLHYNGNKAAVPVPSGNTISSQAKDGIKPQSLSTGCFFNKGLGPLLRDVPLSQVGADELQQALIDLTGGGASAAVSRTIPVRVTKMTAARKADLSKLQAKGQDYVDCRFKKTSDVLGQGTGTVQDCNLAKYDWAGTTGLSVLLRSVDSAVDLGGSGGIASTVPVIDDFRFLA